MIKLFTIGFTEKTAETFFNLLKKAGVKKVIDTRLNNVSQLAGFAKGKDLEFFAKSIVGRQEILTVSLNGRKPQAINQA